MTELDKYRKEIDEIDQELTTLFEKRLETVLKVGEYKKTHDLPILDSSREEAVIQKNTERLNNKAYEQELSDFYKALMTITKETQQKLMTEE
ncbi:chorismate mutase [Alkalibacterium olivapovliticus]|uniref:Chorismate mutase n=1 Tax=Alkalibacterium olivapovliticus TaxID=99907 RepID=A0A2T0W6I4_9LACT|nr:chorismate mutase [Alkalibacterium olivapovliticus]PRY82318.1 chorismate mutase [Alkalibacterium olivapovliticus]